MVNSGKTGSSSGLIPVKTEITWKKKKIPYSGWSGRKLPQKRNLFPFLHFTIQNEKGVYISNYSFLFVKSKKMDNRYLWHISCGNTDVPCFPGSRINFAPNQVPFSEYDLCKKINLKIQEDITSHRFSQISRIETVENGGCFSRKTE